ncbi:hypothetical protein [Microbispora bryophytorum]|uniref:hypothetical protein n=1 Tax=Microbispora bryophytorum TaxID=1460882 RepID=UPI0033F4EB9E
MPVESLRPKYFLIDEDDRILGQCLDAEELYVEVTDEDESVTIELLGCLHTRPFMTSMALSPTISRITCGGTPRSRRSETAVYRMS